MKRLLPVVAMMLLLVVSAAVFAQSPKKKPYAHGTASPGAKDPEVEKLKAATMKLEKQFGAKPADGDLRVKTAEANYKTGHALMMSPKLDRKLKYRSALKYLRRALALNPHHRQALEEKNLIESIYRQMRLPIPQ